MSDVPPKALQLAAIRPLVAMSRIDGRHLHVVFRCPTTGRSETVHWRSPPTGTSALTAELQATSTLYGVRTQVNGLVRSFLGYGAIARLARQAADVTLAGGHPHAQLTVDEEEQALVSAFRSIQTHFEWTGLSWVHRLDEPSRIEQRAGVDGLTAYDHDVAARMVVAVARAHGGISPEERGHLLEIFEDSLETLLARPPLTDAELAQTTRGPARRSILGLVWSIALSDERFDPAEEALLERFGRALGLDREERIALQLEAQTFVLDSFLDRALAWGAHDAATRTQFLQLAGRIGVDEAAALRIEARWQRRRHP